MKTSLKILIFFSVVLSSHIFPKNSDTLFISVDFFKSGIIYLAHPSANIRWRYNAGDSIIWASPDFDDSEWELVNPYLEMSTPEAKNWMGIGWFRKVIRIDSSLQNRQPQPLQS